MKHTLHILDNTDSSEQGIDRAYTYRATVSSLENESVSSSDMSKIVKSPSEWRAILSPEQFAVLRNKATERPFTGKYDSFSKPGIYNCAGCGNPLYRSSTKFDAHCGWPAFYQAIPGAINYHKDATMGMLRTEMTCAKCDGHLGHVFYDEGFKNPTNERHCVNSISLKFSDQ